MNSTDIRTPSKRRGGRTAAPGHENLYIPEPMSGCWLWTSNLCKKGYGRVRINGKAVIAHRVIYRMHKGEIPQGLLLRHKCDVRCCVNPDHLLPGTHLENSQDMFSRGRQYAATGGTRSGERNPRARLTHDQAVMIKAQPKAVRNKDLAAEYGVSYQTIRDIRSGTSWRSLA